MLNRARSLSARSAVGFADMEQLNFARSVWGGEDALLSPPDYGASLGGAFLSPPEYGGPLAAASLESEESSEDSEDYISGLAEEIAQSMLQEDEEEASVKSAPWGIGAPKLAWSSQKMATSPTSPQSTLAGMGGYNWEARSPGGNMGSSSGVSSPSTPQDGDSRDVLYAELLRVKLEDQVKLESQQQMLSLQQQIIQRPTQLATPNVLPLDSQFKHNNVLSAALGKASALKPSRSPRGKGGGSQEDNYHCRGGSKQGWGGAVGQGGYQSTSSGSGSGKGHQSSSSSGRTSRREESVQQYHQFSLFASNINSTSSSINYSNNINKKQEGGGMRAVFLGSPSSRECGGTGVFLPRRRLGGSTQDSRRKPACSTVLLPSHIVHALNLNVEDTLPSSHRRDSPSSHHWRRNPQVIRSKPKDEVSSGYFPTSHSTTLQEVAPDISLPSEWTY